MKGVSVLITDLILTLIVLSVFSALIATVAKKVDTIREYSSEPENVTLGSCFVALLVKGRLRDSLVIASTVNKTQTIVLMPVSGQHRYKQLMRTVMRPYEVRIVDLPPQYGSAGVILVSSLGCSLKPKEVVG